LKAEDHDRIESKVMTLNCNALTVRQHPGQRRGQPANSELEAIGNAVVEGHNEDMQEFIARAPKISYNQEKNYLLLDGAGRGDVTLSSQDVRGGPHQSYIGTRFRYWLDPEAPLQFDGDYRQIGIGDVPAPNISPEAKERLRGL
jgi:hypothetical protein